MLPTRNSANANVYVNKSAIAARIFAGSCVINCGIWNDKPWKFGFVMRILYGGNFPPNFMNSQIFKAFCSDIQRDSDNLTLIHQSVHRFRELNMNRMAAYVEELVKRMGNIVIIVVVNSNPTVFHCFPHLTSFQPPMVLLLCYDANKDLFFAVDDNSVNKNASREIYNILRD